MNFIKKIALAIMSLPIMCSQSIKNVSAYDYYLCTTSTKFKCDGVNCKGGPTVLPGYTGSPALYAKVKAEGKNLCYLCVRTDYEEQFKNCIRKCNLSDSNIVTLNDNKDFLKEVPILHFVGFIDDNKEYNLTNNVKCCNCKRDFSRRDSSYWHCNKKDHCFCSGCGEKIRDHGEQNGSLCCIEKDGIIVGVVAVCPVCEKENNPGGTISKIDNLSIISSQISNFAFDKNEKSN